MENLMEGLLKEIDRVKDIIKDYEAPELKGAGMFAATLMKQDVKRAQETITNNDVVEMLRYYQKLKEWEN